MGCPAAAEHDSHFCPVREHKRSNGMKKKKRTKLQNIAYFAKKHTDKSILLGLSVLSVCSYLVFSWNGLHLAYGDSVSRLNIARKITDNIAPGLAQIGNVWLPLPQLLMAPFAMNYSLWQSGLAGAVVSTAAFITGGLFLYKSSRIITKSVGASLFALGAYALNINILYLQTTAMSEALFLCFLILTIYFFLRWIRYQEYAFIPLSALSVSALTLIRYEGLALLASSVPVIFFFSYFKRHKFRISEGSTIFYFTLAGIGFAMWTVFLTLIFKDPLYWRKEYLSTVALKTDSGIIESFTFHLNYVQAGWKYLTSVLWMNGIIPTVTALVTLPLFIIKSVRTKSYFFIPVVLALSVFVFMILTLQRNTPIHQPQFTLQNAVRSGTSSFKEFNIRYGLLMLPLIALLCGYLFSFRYRIVQGFLIGALAFQVVSYGLPVYTPVFNLPRSLAVNGAGGGRDNPYIGWLKEEYDGGLILITARRHDPQMFALGLPYKSYIHEGAGFYWNESLIRPATYATWVVFDTEDPKDELAAKLSGKPQLLNHFTLVYKYKGTEIYKK